MCKSTSAEGSRTIDFIGVSAEVSQPNNLPFKPPGFKWKRSACITSRQLEQRQGKIEKLHKSFKDADANLP